MERLYGVITARFHIALHPARYGTVQQLTATARAIAILHNMVVEARRDGFTGLQRSTAAALARAVDPECDVSVAPAADAAVEEAALGAADDVSPQGPVAEWAGAASGDAAPVAADAGNDERQPTGSTEGGPEPAGAADGQDAPDTPPVESDDAATGQAAPAGQLMAAPGHPLPRVDPAEVAAEGTFCHGLLAWARATDTGEHLELRHDLSEHVWADGGPLLEPYLQG